MTQSRVLGNCSSNNAGIAHESCENAWNRVNFRFLLLQLLLLVVALLRRQRALVRSAHRALRAGMSIHSSYPALALLHVRPWASVMALPSLGMGRKAMAIRRVLQSCAWAVAATAAFPALAVAQTHP